jgi:hypothetical protein
MQRAPARLRELVPFAASDNVVTRDDGAERASRDADKRAGSVSDNGAKAGKAVAVERGELCAEIAHDQRRNRPLSVAIVIL